VDELEEYKSLYCSRGDGAGSEKENKRARSAAEREKGKGVDREVDAVKAMREMTDVEEVAGMDQRWSSSWKPPLLSKYVYPFFFASSLSLLLFLVKRLTSSPSNRDLRPQRTPLHAKRSKRCPVCKHILIKPEQKSSSTRFKIKLVAANYLPSVTVYRRPPASIGSRLSAIAAGTASGLRRTTRTGAGRGGDSSSTAAVAEEEPLRPGRTYTFELSFTNPLYDPIHVRLAVARPNSTSRPPLPAVATVEGETEQAPTPPPPPFAVNLPSPQFPISAYAEDWEYEDDEEAVLRDEEGDEESGGGEGASPSKKKRRAPGIVERRMNRTTVAMDVAVHRDTVGPLRVRFSFPRLSSFPSALFLSLTFPILAPQANMLVTYVYQVDDGSAPPPSPTKSPQKGGREAAAANVKSFSFWTLVPLGTVQPRPTGEGRRAAAVSSRSSG
jgi:dynactin-4